MALRAKKGFRGSIDDVLSDLLGDDLIPPEKPVGPASNAKDMTGVPQGLPSKSRARSHQGDNVFGTQEDLAGADAGISDISDADPEALLKTLKDLDDMDADILGLKKSHPATGKNAAQGSGKELPSNSKPAEKLLASEKGATISTKKPSPSPSSSGPQYRKFSFEDLEDPLAGLLSDDEEEMAMQPPVTESKSAVDQGPGSGGGPGPSIPLTPGDTPIRKKEDSLFDDGDDIMAALGFGDSPKADKRQMGDQEGPRPARSKLDELLGRGTATKLLARPGTGEHGDFKLNKKYQKPQGEQALGNRTGQDKEDSWDDDIFTFGAYKPSVGSSEGRQSRRQSVRFLAEGGPDPKGELGSKQSPQATSSPINSRKGGADWLGLKDDDLDLLPPSPIPEVQQEGSTTSPPSLPAPASQHSAPAALPSTAKVPAKNSGPPVRASQASTQGASKEKEEEDDWLSHVLSQKKSQGLAREEHSGAQNLMGTARQPHSSSQLGASTRGTEQAVAGAASRATVEEMPAVPPTVAGSPMSWSQTALAPPTMDPKKGTTPGDSAATEPVIYGSCTQEPTVPVQSLRPGSFMQSLPPGTRYQKQLLAAPTQLQSGTAQLEAELLESQARVGELEAQVRKLELEQSHHKLLLESLQQRHQADLELMENAHRSRIKMLETSYQQREERLRRENEELSTQYLTHCKEAEQARAELTAQHQRRLAAAAQEKDQEIERLRDLQRVSIQEMHRDHGEQLQRLKLLKDQEIDAVTSATSYTRSLNGIIQQMEKFSSSLNELSSRVEASHVSTSQERALGIRQQDEQLRALQERLGRQQRDMEEERGRLQEVIVKMEARLNEQSRLLEQERWRATAEQSKAESTQRALEEQRKIMSQQLTIEREELERAKSALLEEQKSVMQKCGEERRRLAAEWAEFFLQQKLSKERAEREAERALQVDSQREGAIISLAKEQAELKVRTKELQAKEERLAAEREALEREQQELRLQQEKIHASALRLQLRMEEVEHMSKVASKKYEEGEQALRAARLVQSEQQARLQVQQEQLRQQEQHVHQEHLSLAQQRQQLDHTRDLPSSILELSTAQLPTAHNQIASVNSAPAISQYSKPSAGPGSIHLITRLLLLKYTAEQDREFLEDEKFFLETLKKASYNLAPHST
ncbi:fas-binding factor 1 isoform X2 [Dipodomys spectabilis]|uniref:fas-binding factor 1 isoform X2 n=1 Tax=Dipodomys spectabilis TaxID=105255 RepID=UPI001C53D2FE|nr:fas-binding factor 1 isoform X2 [Dipodomys spectabilis]